MVGEIKTTEAQMEKQVPNATLSVEEAHTLIGKGNISRGGFYNAINRGEVPNVRLGKRILIPRHAFERWLESAGRATA